jgi:hypothetical protein
MSEVPAIFVEKFSKVTFTKERKLKGRNEILGLIVRLSYDRVVVGSQPAKESIFYAQFI